MCTVVVISDLHIASGPLDDCDAELQGHFVSFLNDLGRRDAAIELVLNGDFLDFVQAEPWSGSDLESFGDNEVPLCFTQEQSIAKLESIHAAHGPVFKALTEFVNGHAGHRATILPGNHDADFYFEGVRERFVEFVGPVRFVLDPVYRPASYPTLWIEHGHQSDPVNRFVWRKKEYWSAASPPIFEDHSGVPRLFECIGTRFLIQFMNRLDRDYPFVDNVKPFSRFVRIFGSSAFVPGYGTLKVAVILGRMLAYLHSTVLDREADVLAVYAETHDIIYQHLAHRLKTLPRARIDAFVQKLGECGFLPEMPLPMYFNTPGQAEPLLRFLSDHDDLLDELEISGASFLGKVPGTLALAAGFSVDETRELVKTADHVLATEPVDLVLMGHTHEPVARSGRPYINTGSWTRYYRFGPSEKTVPWKVLQADSYLTFPYELNYVEVRPGQAGNAQLVRYKDRHA
jgi:UDP-2,3-diacylglucosamine pyrophosphatase LpxH